MLVLDAKYEGKITSLTRGKAIEILDVVEDFMRNSNSEWVRITTARPFLERLGKVK